MPDHTDMSGSRAQRDVIGKQINQYLVSPPTALNSLPAPPAGFTGREHELRELLAALHPAAPNRASGILVSAVSGMAGIGKTALAVVAANNVLDLGWFSGALFVNLRGYDPEPLTPEQALSSLLRSLGSRDEDAADLGAVYRQELTRAASERGGPILIVADNASSAAQVEPLLPGGAHRLLVTSRSGLDALMASRIGLNVLPTGDSLNLLWTLLTTTGNAPERLFREPGAAEAIIRACAGLPLALRICASLLCADPGRPLSELAEEFATDQRLAALDNGHDSVARLLDLAIERLTPEQERLYTLLGAAPGRNISTDAVAALLDSSPRRARALLQQLADTHLVWRAELSDRWTTHDLVDEHQRARARRQEDNDQRAAVIRFLDHYMAASEKTWAQYNYQGKFTEGVLTADNARQAAFYQLLSNYTIRAEGAWERYSRQEEFTEEEGLFSPNTSRARMWFYEESDNLLEAVYKADAVGHSPAAIHLALRWGSLDFRTHADTAQSLPLLTLVRKHAQIEQDRMAEALAWSYTANTLREEDGLAPILAAHHRALVLYGECGEQFGEATSWFNLAVLSFRAGKRNWALSAVRRCLPLLKQEPVIRLLAQRMLDQLTKG